MAFFLHETGQELEHHVRVSVFAQTGQGATQVVVVVNGFGEEEGSKELLKSQMLEGVLSHFGQVVPRDVAVQQPHSERSKRLPLSFVNDEVSVEDRLVFLCAAQATLAWSVSSSWPRPLEVGECLSLLSSEPSPHQKLRCVSRQWRDGVQEA